MLSHEDYTVGWISALPLEMRAAKAMLEDVHPNLPQRATDSNSYTLGTIYGHNVVLACLPYGVYGTTSAASVLTNMIATFPSLEFALMVGIGGGVPGNMDVRLGDVVVSKPTGTYGGVVQYDYGKAVSGRFQQTGVLNQPPQVLLTSIAQLQADQLAAEMRPLSDIISKVFDHSTEMKGQFASPGPARDHLFSPSYGHPDFHDNCDECDRDQIVQRAERPFTEPEVHYGLIASGNQVMKDAVVRDQLAQKLGIICFEMEAAGLMNQLPCLVIRGICDYSDSHKNKVWQGYAALTAAAYGKLLLSVVSAAPVRLPRPEQKKTMTAEEKTCFRALFLTDPAEDMNALKRRKGERVPGTCDWILETDEVRLWLGVPEVPHLQRNTSDILWLFGNPGTGKSTIAIAMAEELPRKCYFNRRDKMFAYFFCDSSSEDRRTVTGILRGLLYQLIQQRPELINFIFSKYEERGERVLTSFDTLWGTLLEMGRDTASGDKYFLIDALDECEPESQETLLTQISQSFKTQGPSNCGIHFTITSRPYPEIGRHLGEFNRKDLASYAKVKRDLQLFINKRVDELGKKNKYPEKIATEVSQILQDKAEGMFLWVGIACTELIHVRSRDVIRRLKTLPQGLHSLYQKLLDTAFENDQDSDSIVQMLGFIANSRRPLTVAELSEACELYGDEDEESRLAFTREDIEMCRLMIVVEDGIVRLLHKSVKDFLLGAREGKLLDDLKVHNTLASRCIRHVILGSSKNTFLKYAVLYWPEHAVLAKSAFVISPEHESFFHVYSREREGWLVAYRGLRIFADIPGDFSIFHIAARWGILQIVRFVLERPERDSGAEQYRYIDEEFTSQNGTTPLEEAAKQGHLEVLTLLSGARIRGGILTEKVIVAAASNEENGNDIIRFLLQDTEGSPVQPTEAVLCAAVANHGCGKEILPFLLDRITTSFRVLNLVNMAANNHMTGKDMVQILLRRNRSEFDIDSETMACLHKYFDVEVIKLLMSRENGKIRITKNVVLALSQNNQNGQHIMAFLMNQEHNYEPILNGLIGMHIKDWRHAKRLLRVLVHPEPRKVRITQRLTLAALRNREVGEEVLEMLVDLPENQLVLEPEAAFHICQYFDSHIVKRLLLEHRRQIKVTERLVNAACGNAMQGASVVALLLQHIDTPMQLTSAIAATAASNRQSGKAILKLLLGHEKIRFSFAAASQILQYGDSDVVKWFVDAHAGHEKVKITRHTILDAVSDKTGDHIKLLLTHPAYPVDITPDAVEVLFQLYDAHTVRHFLSQNAGRLQFTTTAVRSACTRFEYGDLLLLLQKQGRQLQYTEDFLDAVDQNLHMTQREKLQIMELLVIQGTKDTVSEVAPSATIRDSFWSTLMKMPPKEQDEWAWGGPVDGMGRKGLDSLPVGITVRFASMLGHRDYIHLSRASRKLYARMRSEAIAKVIVQNHLLHTKWGQMANDGRMRHWDAVESFYHVTEATAAGWPYAVIVLGTTQSFVYHEGYLCYLCKGDIRILNVHGLASFEQVLNVTHFSSRVSEHAIGRKSQLTLMFYSSGILAMTVGFPELKETWLVAIHIGDLFDKRSDGVLVRKLLTSTSQLFVRHSTTYLYYGTYLDDLRQWEINCIHLKSGNLPTTTPLMLDGAMAKLKRTSACFELHEDNLYVVIRHDDINGKDNGYICSYAWACLSPRLSREEAKLHMVWRPRGYRDQICGPFHDAFIQKDGTTGRLFIFECQQPDWWIDRSLAGCFRYPLPFPNEIQGEISTSSQVHIPKEPLCISKGPSNLSNSANKENGLSMESHLRRFHHEYPDRIDMSELEQFRSTKTLSYTYKSSSSTLIEFIQDGPIWEGAAFGNRIYLRAVSYPQGLPLDGQSETTQLDIPPDQDTLEVGGGQTMNERFGFHDVSRWPSKTAPAILHDLLHPPDGTGKVNAVFDDRSIIYTVSQPGAQEQQLALVSFDPKIGFPGLKRFDQLRPGETFPPTVSASSNSHASQGNFEREDELASLLPLTRNEIATYLHINKGIWVR